MRAGLAGETLCVPLSPSALNETEAMKTPSQILRLLVLTSLMATAQAQEVSIPDPGLNAAIRDALQKPAGPLTTQDMLSLTNLDAGFRGVSSLERSEESGGAGSGS